jgi:hypothetical protein
VNFLVSLSEDRKLTEALKKLEVGKSAGDRAAEAPKNDCKALEKKIDLLSEQMKPTYSVLLAIPPSRFHISRVFHYYSSNLMVERRK